MEAAAPVPSRRRRHGLALQPGSSSVAMSAAPAAEGVPKSVLLEPVVFRRDDDESFPDDTEAPIRASGTTSWGVTFRIAFSFAEPPKISRLYAQLPGFPAPDKEEPLRMVATHRHLALLEVGISIPSQGPLQNFFIFRAQKNNPSSQLTALPPCTEPEIDYHNPRPRRKTPDVTPHQLMTQSTGLWCGDKEEEEFVVAELTLCVRILGQRCVEAQANICFLRSSFTGDQPVPHKWDTMHLPILSPTNEDLLKLCHWQNDAVIPFQRWLCWIDYHRGILFCDVSKKVPPLAVSFRWFPEDSYSLASSLKTPCSGNGGVSVVDQGRTLKFAYVARHDSGPAFGAPKPGTRFTITSHTLVLQDNGRMDWETDYTVSSADLPDYLQRGGIPMFPRVDIDRPHLVHFLFCEFGKAYKRMSVLSIDMSTKTVESFYLCVDANVFYQSDKKDCLPTNDPMFVRVKSLPPFPSPFLPCELPRFCCLSRKREDTE